MTVLATYYHLIAKGRLTPEELAAMNNEKVLVENVKSAVQSAMFNEYTQRKNVRLLKVIISKPLDNPKTVVRLEAFIQSTTYQEGHRICIVDSQFLGEKIQIENNRDIKVDEKWQSWGVGRIVLSHWIEWAQNDCPAVDVEPILPVQKRRDQLIKFYTVFGFSWKLGLDRSDPVGVLGLEKAPRCSYQIDEHRMVGILWMALRSSSKDLNDVIDIVKKYKKALALSGTFLNRVKIVLFGANPAKLR